MKEVLEAIANGDRVSRFRALLAKTGNWNEAVKRFNAELSAAESDAKRPSSIRPEGC